ncbi:hypothetical protein BSL78_15984 [Apostichopus japonicus]|uniref:Uncharacterized protein n=1 Tax=Stichopus japonicus TaxID=307972 RepID=A0A2G8KGK8_STIJA|nr:hypothetical protein BSL78_15984 [Apostichopus japonicus]
MPDYQQLAGKPTALAPRPTGPPGHQPNGHRPNARVASPPLVMMMLMMMVMMVVMMIMMMITMMMVYTSQPPLKTVKGFGRFKAKLADILTEKNSLQLATFFHYPPAKIDLLKQNKDSRNHLMIRYMEERGEITETDITTLLHALKVLNLHVIKKRVQSLFELHTGKLCTGDDQSMQQPEDTMATNVKYVDETAKKNNSTALNFGKLDLGPKGYMTADGTSLRLESFRSADKDNIFLANGKSVPVMPALEELQIKTNKGTELNQDQVLGLLSYARHCQRLKKLSFIDCLLPLYLSVGSLSPFTKLRNIQVSWTPTEHGFHLDFSRGRWVSNSKEATTLEVSRFTLS